MAIALPQPLLDFIGSSRIPLTLADASTDDCPLIVANQAFYDLTGYGPEEVIGRNCRFLQPEGGAGPVRERIRDFLESEQGEERFLVANKRKDGTPFLNLLYLTKLKKALDFNLILGSQFDGSRADKRIAALYDEALDSDLRALSSIAGEYGATLFGTYRSLASSAGLIAQAKLDD